MSRDERLKALEDAIRSERYVHRQMTNRGATSEWVEQAAYAERRTNEAVNAMRMRDVSRPDLSHLTPGQRAALRLALCDQREEIERDGWILYVRSRESGGREVPMTEVRAVQDGHHELMAELERRANAKDPEQEENMPVGQGPARIARVSYERVDPREAVAREKPEDPIAFERRRDTAEVVLRHDGDYGVTVFNEKGYCQIVLHSNELLELFGQLEQEVRRLREIQRRAQEAAD